MIDSFCVLCPCGGMVDAADLKSADQSVVGVQVPPRAPYWPPWLSGRAHPW